MEYTIALEAVTERCASSTLATGSEKYKSNKNLLDTLLNLII